MDPMLVGESSRDRGPLADLAVDPAARSAGFRRALPDGVRAALADSVRSMNCYYSNFIEGHETHPVDIERALRNDYSADPRKRDLQLEAVAHIEVQRWVDGGALKGRAQDAESIREVHRRFYEHLPDAMLCAQDDRGDRSRIAPGELRTRDVHIGGHLPVSPGAVPRFLAHFEESYRALGRIDAILAAAAAHHRLLWIHPFLDGNGRVARLMTHAMLLDALDTGGLWSASRGLARKAADYKALLARCDLVRRNDLDGRGSLSQEELARFTRFFLETCIDQVAFMESLVQPDHLRARVVLWAAEEAHIGALPPKAGAILEAILYRGELPRSEVPGLLGVTDRHARRTVAALTRRGVVVSEGARAPLRLAFPAALAPRWMPGLFPEESAPTRD
jgi:Fic family protein